jgi:hypothetical protein
MDRLHRLMGLHRQRKSIPPGENESVIETVLANFCAIRVLEDGTRQTISAETFRQISNCLNILDRDQGRSEQHLWASRPRTYTVLRNINALHLMDDYAREGYTDWHLPFSENNFPEFINNQTIEQQFLHHQQCAHKRAWS